MALTEKLTSIADAIRTKTGSADKLTLDGMATAIAGIETGGGSGGGASGIYMAKITPAEDMDRLDVTHNLGTTDILLAVCFAETLGDITPTKNATMARFYAKTDVPFRFGSTSSGDNYQVYSNYLVASGWVNGGGAASETYCCCAIDENCFRFIMSANNIQYTTGVTYTVIIVSASGFSAS